MMKKLITDFPEHLREAADLTIENVDSIPHKAVNGLITGMGGSGIGGRLAVSILSPVCSRPLATLSDYRLPAYVNTSSLVVASSFSGNTEETLSAINDALERKAKIVALTSGGALKDLAQENDWAHVLLPVKAASPRAHLGFSLVALMKLLHHTGFAVKSYDDEFRKSADLLHSQQADIKASARETAEFLKGALPIIYSGQRLLPAATRLRQQINENAKQLAHEAPIPEMNHNELVAWHDKANLLSATRFLFIETDYDHQRSRLRREILQTMIPETVKSLRFQAKGESYIQQLMYFIHWGDWVSFYLAEQNQVDPFPVNIIEDLKKNLLK
ncbi:MAG: bifunctional phosphoglucose/phosphomannose isomerase [Bacteroidota bacterium]